jgi:hypothetical protein
MFSTTLRIPEDLAAFLQQAAAADSVSVNAYLAKLLEQERLAARKRQLARDWAAFGADVDAQDVGYALEAQAEIAAERSTPYRVEQKPEPPTGHGTRTRTGKKR